MRTFFLNKSMLKMEKFTLDDDSPEEGNLGAVFV